MISQPDFQAARGFLEPAFRYHRIRCARKKISWSVWHCPGAPGMAMAPSGTGKGSNPS